LSKPTAEQPASRALNASAAMSEGTSLVKRRTGKRVSMLPQLAIVKRAAMGGRGRYRWRQISARQRDQAR